MDSPIRLASKANRIRREEGTFEMGKRAYVYVRKRISPARLRGRFKDALTLECEGVSVTFDTTTSAAKQWFYPRYIDGSLHEPALTAYLLRSLDEETTFYDVGGNVGYFTVFGAARCENGQVHSFEPNSTYVDTIRRSLERNDLEATLVQKAVATVDGDEVEYVGGAGPGSKPTPAQTKMPAGWAETVTLDTYCRSATTPEVVKIDVEGFEYHVLSGAKKLLRSDPPREIFVEVHPRKLREYGHNDEDVLRLLEQAGYDIRVLPHRTESLELRELGSGNVTDNTMLICSHST